MLSQIHCKCLQGFTWLRGSFLQYLQGKTCLFTDCSEIPADIAGFPCRYFRFPCRYCRKTPVNPCKHLQCRAVIHNRMGRWKNQSGKGKLKGVDETHQSYFTIYINIKWLKKWTLEKEKTQFPVLVLKYCSIFR